MEFTVVCVTKERPAVGHPVESNLGWTVTFTLESPTLLLAVERVLATVPGVESLTVTAGKAQVPVEVPEMWGLGQAAELLGVTREAVRLMCVSGRLPAFRIDSSWVVLADDVREFKKLRQGG